MKKRISAALLSVVLCLSLLSIAALGAASTPTISVSGSSSPITVTASGLNPDTTYYMCSVTKGNTLLALFNLETDGTGHATAQVAVGPLAENQKLTVSIPDQAGNATEPLVKQEYTIPASGGNDTPEPTKTPEPTETPAPTPTPTSTPDNGGGGGGGGSGGGGGGGGGSSATNSPKIEKNTGGTVKVSSDGKTVTITPKDGYRIKDVIINGQSVGAVTKYVFDKASSKNTVEVVFEKIPDGETPDTTPSTPSFNDVTGHWAANAINFVVNEGLFNGTSSTTFSPNAPMTRSMLATVLYRLAGEPRVSGASSFADVPAGQWYSNAVVWAAQNGIVTGTGAGFSPDGNITREQLATMLYRYCAFVKGNTSASKPLNFPDASKVSSWASEAMQWAVGAGIINGTDTGALNPGGYATRAEVATMLMRFVSFLG